MGNQVWNAAEISAKGSLTLFIGNLIALLASSVGSIIVARLLSPTDYGIYTIVLILPNFMNIFAAFGERHSLVRNIARDKSINEARNVVSLVKASLLLKFIFSGLLTLVLLLFPDLVTNAILKRPEISEYVKISSLIILSQSILNSEVNIFTGLERMSYRASVNILQSIVKGLVSPILVYLGYGVWGLIVGHVSSYIVAAIFGLILVNSIIHNFPKDESDTILNSVKVLMGFGLPLFIVDIISGISRQFRGFLLSWYIPSEIIGNYGIANWFTILTGVIIASIGIVIYPTFSKFDINKTREQTRDIYYGSIRYSTLFLLPMLIIIMVISKPLTYMFFGSKYPFAPLYLTLLLIPSLNIGLGALSNIKFLYSQGETRPAFIISMTSSISTILLSIVFIQLWNIEGLLLSFIPPSLVRSLLGLYIIKKKYGFSPDLSHSGKVLLCSIVSGGLSLSSQWIFKSHFQIIIIGISVTVFFVTYLLLAPLFGVIKNKDLENLDAMLPKIPIISQIAKKVLKLENFLLYKYRKQ